MALESVEGMHTQIPTDMVDGCCMKHIRNLVEMTGRKANLTSAPVDCSSAAVILGKQHYQGSWLTGSEGTCWKSKAYFVLKSASGNSETVNCNMLVQRSTVYAKSRLRTKSLK